MARGGHFDNPRSVRIERWGVTVVASDGRTHSFHIEGGDGIQEDADEALVPEDEEDVEC